MEEREEIINALTGWCEKAEDRHAMICITAEKGEDTPNGYEMVLTNDLLGRTSLLVEMLRKAMECDTNIAGVVLVATRKYLAEAMKNAAAKEEEAKPEPKPEPEPEPNPYANYF